MKIKLLALTLFLIASQLFAQDAAEEVKYRRSSLHMILIESETFPSKESVMKSWNGYPFPDKYNNHHVDIATMSPSGFTVTPEELILAGKKKEKKSAFGKLTASTTSDISNSAMDATGGVLDKETKEMPIKIDKFIVESGLAKQIVAKWFNVTADGNMDMKLVQERGFYNASEMDAALAAGQARGSASLGDAGEELISKTFVSFSKLNFLPNEPVAAAVRDAAILAAQSSGIPGATEAAVLVANEAYEITKDGYSVWTNTWLYQLDWNDTIANEFWKLWKNKEAFENSDIFKLKYIGKESSQSLVTKSLKKGGLKKTDEELIDIATVRNVDNVFGKLQKEYDVFKPVTPVFSSEPITAKIGLKEGVKKGDKFEVLEMTWDKKTGKTVWKSIGKCSVEKKIPIWDNRYAVGEEHDVVLDEEGNPIENVTVTTFKGSKKIQPGMLLRQLK